jgi:hypothetical protein
MDNYFSKKMDYELLALSFFSKKKFPFKEKKKRQGGSQTQALTFIHKWLL